MKKHIGTNLWISAKTHKHTRKTSRAMSRAEYREICGIFYQRGSQLILGRKLNRVAQAGAFKVRMADLKMAKHKTEGVWGAFHSHPISDANPSKGDVKGGPWRGFALIYDVIGDEFRLWRVERGDYTLIKCFNFDREWLFEPLHDL